LGEGAAAGAEVKATGAATGFAEGVDGAGNILLIKSAVLVDCFGASDFSGTGVEMAANGMRGDSAVSLPDSAELEAGAFLGRDSTGFGATTETAGFGGAWNFGAGEA